MPGIDGEVAVDALFEGGVLLARFGALIPGLEGDEEESVEGALHGAEQIESKHACDMVDARRFQERLFHLARRVARSFHGSRVRQRERAIEITLILLRQETRR